MRALQRINLSSFRESKSLIRLLVDKDCDVPATKPSQIRKSEAQLVLCERIDIHELEQ